ncbi:MAG: hypothetical protein ACJ74W_08245 [Pyrinomonadaceae bacterium]
MRRARTRVVRELWAGRTELFFVMVAVAALRSSVQSLLGQGRSRADSGARGESVWTD